MLRGPRHHSVDASGQRHVFRGQPALTFWSGVSLLAISVVFVVTGFIAGPIDSQSLVLWAFAILFTWFGIRCLRVGVVVSPDGMQARNFFRTRSAQRSQISAINLHGRDEGQSGYRWFPQVQLINGSTFWVSCLDCGRIGQNPLPDRLEQLHEVRRMLNVEGTDAGDNKPRPGLMRFTGNRVNRRGQ
jgi:hypothetical protein